MRPRTVIALAILLLAPGAAAEAAKRKRPQIPSPSSHAWINPKLGLEYSQWLVGARAWMATPEEVETFMALSDDEAAAAFEREFWRRRDADASVLFGGLEQTFDERAEEADNRFGEGARLGRKTDRGAIYVLYGEPAEIEFETSAESREPTLEVWTYPADSSEGLDGREPPRRLFFEQQDGQTSLAPGRVRSSRIRAVR